MVNGKIPTVRKQHTLSCHCWRSLWYLLKHTLTLLTGEKCRISVSLKVGTDSQWIYFNYTLTYFIQLNCVRKDIAWGSVFESQSQQLVDVTFVSYFKSSFHSKLKILLLAVTFRCDWLCWTVKKWKLDPRLAVCSTVIETCYSVGRQGC